MDQRERREKLEKLAGLSDIQVQVMYYRCLDKKVSEITDILGIDNEKTVWTRFTKIFEKLGITEDDKERELAINYCPLFLEFVKSEDDWKNWGLIRAEIVRRTWDTSPEADPQHSSAAPSHSESELPKPENSDEAQKREQLVVTPPPQPRERRRLPWILIAFPLLILCLLCVSAVPFGWQYIERFIGNTITIAQATRQPTPIPSTETQQPTDTTAQLPVATQPPVAQVLTDTPIATPTSQPSETPIPTSTTTPTITNTPGPTLTPTNMSLGDTGSDARVSLKLGNDLAYDIDYGGRPAVGFRMEFSNHSGESILLNYNPGDFNLVDNLGREYECYFILRPPYSWQRKDESVNIKTGSTYKFTLGCGPGMELDGDVTSLVLSVAQFSSLTNLVWDIEIPR